jgi:hypothetical protein
MEIQKGVIQSPVVGLSFPFRNDVSLFEYYGEGNE